MNDINKAMQKGIKDSVFPGGALVVSKQGKILFFKSYGLANIFTGEKITKETIFDLASLTKPLATSLAFMLLIQEKCLSLDQKLGTILNECNGTDKENILIRHLLCHNSALPAHRPYYKELCKLPIHERKPALRDLLIKEPLLDSIGHKFIYSDLGFMFLEWVVEKITRTRLDIFLEKRVYRPLGLSHLFYIDLFSKKNLNMSFAATEDCPWRKKVLAGMVHDDNAYVTGGIGGHAGLFGRAYDVHSLLVTLLLNYQGMAVGNIFNPSIVRIFFTPMYGSRTPGLDTPTFPGSSCGNLFSNKTVGHLGFTGTSFWIDLKRSIIVLFLSNRVHPSRNNEKIKDFRPYLHDIIMKTFLSKTISL
ncbi:Beta-lactamase family protein [Candidatus Magnetomoraceae bacterium gMMP-1]